VNVQVDAASATVYGETDAESTTTNANGATVRFFIAPSPGDAWMMDTRGTTRLLVTTRQRRPAVKFVH
jgi:hypothetical protein